MPKPRPRCGTPSGYQSHLYHHEPPCDECRAAKTEYNRTRRGYQASHPAECGTRAGYNRHLDRHEQTCPECRAASAEYRRQYRRNRRAA